jgi:fructose-1,6-bisphosphatase I
MFVRCFGLQALDLVPEKIHDRSPIFLGSYDEIEQMKELYAESKANGA